MAKPFDWRRWMVLGGVTIGIAVAAAGCSAREEYAKFPFLGGGRFGSSPSSSSSSSGGSSSSSSSSGGGSK
jgi:hypothetical protein